MKMSRADKRRRKTAKIVEMKLDGMKEDSGSHWMKLSFEELHEEHRRHKTAFDYYGKSVTQMVLDHQAKLLRRHIDNQLIQEALNGKPK